MDEEQGAFDVAPGQTGEESPIDGAKRRQILEGARKVFLADGFDGASMNEIARVAGVSKGTLYVYFGSKEALFEGLVWEDRRRQAEQLFELDLNNPDIRAVLCRLGESLLSHMLRPETIALSRTVIGISGKLPQVGRAFYAAGPEFGATRLAGYLDRQVAAGRLAIADTPVAAMQFLELCHAGIFKAVLFGVDLDPTPEDIRLAIGRSIDMFLAAYARPGA